MFDPSHYIINGTYAYYCSSTWARARAKHLIQQSGSLINCTILTIDLSTYMLYQLGCILWKKLKVVRLHKYINISMELGKNLLCLKTDEVYNTPIVLNKKMLFVILGPDYIQPIDMGKNLRVMCIEGKNFNQPIGLPKNLKYFQIYSTSKHQVYLPNHLIFMGIAHQKNNSYNIVFPEHLYILNIYSNDKQYIDALSQNVHAVVINGLSSYKHANLPNRTLCLSNGDSQHKQFVNDVNKQFNEYVKKILDVNTFIHRII